jgi:hypothetical protein
MAKGGLPVNMKAWAVVLAVVCIIGAGLAGAQDAFGVKVYTGAKPDEETTQFLKNSMHVDAFCYRTTDDVSKVVQFYKIQPGLTLIDESKEGGMFKAGDIDITIQSPWMDMKTGKMNKDTLISIVKNKAEVRSLKAAS